MRRLRGGKAARGKLGCRQGGERLEQLAILLRLTEVVKVWIVLQRGEVCIAQFYRAAYSAYRIIKALEE